MCGYDWARQDGRCDSQAWPPVTGPSLVGRMRPSEGQGTGAMADHRCGNRPFI